MSKLLIALFVTAGLGLAGCATQRDAPVAAARPMAPAAPITKDTYDTAVKNAEMQAKIDKDACSSRSGNAKDICLAEANGKEKVAKADAEAAYKSTPKAREDARVTRAEATHNVAKKMRRPFRQREGRLREGSGCHAGQGQSRREGRPGSG